MSPCPYVTTRELLKRFSSNLIVGEICRLDHQVAMYVLTQLLLIAYKQWRTGQGVSLPDGKWALWAPLNLRKYVKNVNDLLVA
jgi:hypothetical protein